MNSKITMVIRLLVGAAMTFFGVMKFFQSGPIEMGGLTELMTILNEGGFLYVVGALETIGGILLLTNKFVPAALILLSTTLTTVVLFHIIWQPEGLVPSAPLLVLTLYLIYSNKDRYGDLFKA